MEAEQPTQCAILWSGFIRCGLLLLSVISFLSPPPPTAATSPVGRTWPHPLSGLSFLPRINGHPGKSTRLAGLWKLEEVSIA